jgi:hypothetical protein
MRLRNIHKIFLFALTFVYILYAGIYIYRTSFIELGERYFVLFDDAMISMRYAKNFAEGNGLVWNPGEKPVEGYTNPLWVIFMSVFHLLPLPAAKISLAVQISGAVFLSLNLYFVYRIAVSLSNNPILSLLPVMLTAFYTPLNNWGLQGMEVSVLVLMISAAVWMTLKNQREGTFSPWIYILLGVGTLVRVDMAVPYGLLFCYLIIADPKHRRKNITWGLGLLLLFLLSQTIFRWLYYGDVLPNTYYLKMSGIPLVTRIKRGFYVLFQLIIQMNWVLILLPFSILFYRRDRTVVLLFLILIGQIAYSVYVGGDAWEHKGGSNRYIALAIPIFFTLFVYAADKIRVGLLSLIEKPSQLIYQVANFGVILVIMAGMVNFNFMYKTRTLRQWILIRQPAFIEANIEAVQIALALEKFTTPQAHIGVVTAGAIPYFSNRPAIDFLGKNDATIAHLPNHIPAGLADIRPGHMKWDYDYSIGELKPDVVVQLWGDSQAAEDYLDQFYVTVEIDGLQFSALKGSADILWERFEN